MFQAFFAYLNCTVTLSVNYHLNSKVSSNFLTSSKSTRSFFIFLTRFEILCYFNSCVLLLYQFTKLKDCF